MIREPIKQRRGHLRISEYACPLGEAQVGGDDKTCALVELAHQVEQYRPAGLADRQVTKLVENDQIGVQQPMGDLPRFANRLLLLERVDELDGVEEAHAHAMMLDRLHPDCGGEMRLAGSGSAHQHDVVPLLDELTAMQL